MDILVNDAGIQHVEPLEDFPIETFETILRIMLTAPFVLTRAVLPGMYERGWGRIIHVSSAHGRRASPFKVAYVTAKHGLEGLSKVIALEGAEHGVTSNCINPGTCAPRWSRSRSPTRLRRTACPRTRCWPRSSWPRRR